MTITGQIKWDEGPLKVGRGGATTEIHYILLGDKVADTKENAYDWVNANAPTTVSGMIIESIEIPQLVKDQPIDGTDAEKIWYGKAKYKTGNAIIPSIKLKPADEDQDVRVSIRSGAGESLPMLYSMEFVDEVYNNDAWKFGGVTQIERLLNLQADSDVESTSSMNVKGIRVPTGSVEVVVETIRPAEDTLPPVNVTISARNLLAADSWELTLSEAMPEEASKTDAKIIDGLGQEFLIASITKEDAPSEMTVSATAELGSSGDTPQLGAATIVAVDPTVSEYLIRVAGWAGQNVINKLEWKGWPAGSLKLISFDANQDAGDGDDSLVNTGAWQVTYTFAAAGPTSAADLNITANRPPGLAAAAGPGTSFTSAKRGHDHLDILYMDSEVPAAGGRPSFVVPSAVRMAIHRIYEEVDFAEDLKI